ncbi:MAG: hypothetical protein ACHP7N_11330 [Caulobacterales bacterium]
MPADRTITAARKPMARSRVGNGKVLVEGVDGRSAQARRLRDVIADLTADLGGDLGEAERLQVRAVAGLVVHGEHLTADMLNGRDVDSEQLTRVSNSAARLLAALKRNRQRRAPPAATPTLAEYLAAKRQAEAAPA